MVLSISWIILDSATSFRLCASMPATFLLGHWLQFQLTGKRIWYLLTKLVLAHSSRNQIEVMMTYRSIACHIPPKHGRRFIINTLVLSTAMRKGPLFITNEEQRWNRSRFFGTVSVAHFLPERSGNQYRFSVLCKIRTGLERHRAV